MKINIEFDLTNEDEQDWYDQLDVGIRTYFGCIKMALTGAGATDVQVQQAIDLCKYQAISDDTKATINLDCPMTELFEALDDMDVDVSRLHKYMETMGGLFN